LGGEASKRVNKFRVFRWFFNGVGFSTGTAAERMKTSEIGSGLILGALLFPLGVCAQAPEGPMTPQPGIEVQKGPPGKTIKLHSILVNTPVTVRNAEGEMVHNLEESDFRITDNGVEQRITHFNLGGDPISLVVVVETSSRIEALLPELRKTGILITQAVAGPTGEIAVVGFNDSVDKLQDFTTNADKVERAMSRLDAGTSGTKLYDAMAKGVEMLSGRPEVSAHDLGHRRVMLVLAEAHDSRKREETGRGAARGAIAEHHDLFRRIIKYACAAAEESGVQAATKPGAGRDVRPAPRSGKRRDADDGE